VFQDVWLNMILWTSMADMLFKVSPHLLIASHRLGQASYRNPQADPDQSRPLFVSPAIMSIRPAAQSAPAACAPSWFAPPAHSLESNRSLPHQLQSLFTLSSKFFSSFVHNLFAIGFSPLFSLRCHLPPHWNCIPKQSYSLMIRIRRRRKHPARYGTLTLSGVAFQRTLTASLRRIQTIFETTIQLVSWFQSLSYISYSLAATRDISVDFFSSAD
jgi:hypothetical protein